MRLLSNYSFLILTLIFVISCKKRNIPINDASTTVPTTVSNILAYGWTYEQPEIVNNTPVPDIFFLDSKYGAFITNKDLYITDNGGLNWNRFVNKDFNNIGNGIYNMFITPGKSIYMIGNQYLFRIKNDSVTVITNNFSGTDIYFINEKNGYISNSNGAHSSIDSGKTWKPIKFAFSVNNTKSLHSSLSFLTNGKGLISSDKLCATNLLDDTAWIVQPDPGLNNICATYMISENLSFLSTDSGIYKSQNGGQTFNKKYAYSNTKKTYVDIHFVDEKIGYFCKDNQIFKTIDGGDKWSLVVDLRSNKNESIIELHFTSPNNGWACTSKGGILKYKM